MKTPPLTTRLLGNPVVALCMWGWLLHALAGWYLQQPSIAETIFAGFFALCSLNSWRKMRVHQAWLRQWGDTGRDETETPARIPASRRKSALMFVLPVVGLMLLLLAANSAPGDEMPLLRLLSLGCVAWLGVAALVRKVRKHGGGQVSSAVKMEPQTAVAWMSGPAHSAPSRSDACKDLPEYCARIMR